MIGNEAANNLVFDNNEIPARNTGFDTAPEYVGVLAQELKAAGPYMVTTPNTKTGNANEGYLQVDNGAMTYMVINVVKEQQNHDYRAGKKMCRFIIAK